MKKYSLFLLFIVTFIVVSILTSCAQKRKVLKGFKSTKYTSAARHKATMHSYKVLGKRYFPANIKIGQVMYGVSSWYGPDFHGKYTSNGEIYDMYKRTAAHKTWPMDTIVRVKNLENGKSTVVRINDRGPFVKGRIIDCSYLAGRELGLDKMGIAKVEIQVIGCAGKISSKSRITKNILNNKKDRILPNKYGIQLGAFASLDSAKRLEYSYKQKYKEYTPMIKSYILDDGSVLYRVILLGFDSEQDVKIFKKNNGLTGQLYSQK